MLNCTILKYSSHLLKDEPSVDDDDYDEEPIIRKKRRTAAPAASSRSASRSVDMKSIQLGLRERRRVNYAEEEIKEDSDSDFGAEDDDEAEEEDEDDNERHTIGGKTTPARSGPPARSRSAPKPATTPSSSSRGTLEFDRLAPPPRTFNSALACPSLVNVIFEQQAQNQMRLSQHALVLAKNAGPRSTTRCVPSSVCLPHSTRVDCTVHRSLF